MTPEYFKQLMERLMQLGLHITMFMENGTVWFDLNTGMKSQLHVRYDENNQILLFKTRYNESGTIEDWNDLIYVARRCMCGRDFTWFDILKADLEQK